MWSVFGLWAVLGKTSNRYAAYARFDNSNDLSLFVCTSVILTVSWVDTRGFIVTFGGTERPQIGPCWRDAPKMTRRFPWNEEAVAINIFVRRAYFAFHGVVQGAGKKAGHGGDPLP